MGQVKGFRRAMDWWLTNYNNSVTDSLLIFHSSHHCVFILLHRGWFAPSQLWSHVILHPYPGQNFLSNDLHSICTLTPDLYARFQYGTCLVPPLSSINMEPSLHTFTPKQLEMMNWFQPAGLVLPVHRLRCFHRGIRTYHLLTVFRRNVEARYHSTHYSVFGLA